MNLKRLISAFVIVMGFGFTANAQLVCPPNIDFELGDLSGWTFFVGTYPAGGGTPIGATPSTAIPCRHTLTKATGLIGCAGPGPVGPTDQYGGFPVIAPGGGSYSMRVGNNVNGQSIEKARFYIHIPPGSDNYSLIYRYAVVFQDPGHPVAQQPKFLVTVFDSLTTALAGGVPQLVHDTACSYFLYTAGGTLPGFITNSTCPTCSPATTATNPVQFKGWTTATVDLSGLAGTTVGIDFLSADCSQGGHFGYGYIDMSCGLFKISASICDTNTPPVLVAPDGFAAYTWYDSATFTILYGTGMTITIPFPPSPTTIAVILTPFPGYGCPDTLYTHISPSALALNPSNDTSICRGRSVVLESNATDIVPPIYYNWTPSSTLSCATCANPVATPTVTTAYTLIATNVNGCTQEHVYNISLLPDLVTTVTFDTPSCHGYTNGTATIHVLGGTPPNTYTWFTAPIQTDSTAVGLGGGIYMVVATDDLGCTDTNSVSLPDPAPWMIYIDTFYHPTSCLGLEGSIVLEGTIVPARTYTVVYSIGGVPQTRTVVADPTGRITLTGLGQGTYSDITIIGALCVYNVAGPVILVDPPTPDLSGVTSNSFVCVGDTLKLFASSTTAGVAYTWAGPGGYNSGLPNPIIVPAAMGNAGVYTVTVSRANCFNYATALVEIRPLPVPVGTSNSPVCSNDTLMLISSSSTGATSYVWNGPNFFNSYNQNPYIAHVQTVSTGIYTVAITLNGCTVSDTVDVLINQTPLPPVVKDTNYCQNDIAVGMDATGSGLLWYTVPNGGVADPIVPVPNTAIAAINTRFVTQTSPEGCTSQRAKVTARVWLYPKLNLALTDSVSCAGKYITFTVENVEEGNSGFTWQFEGSDEVTNMNPVYHAFNTVGAHTVSTSAHYLYCPTIVMKKVINTYPYPSFDLGRDTSICPGSSSIQLSAAQVNTFGYPATWKWGTGEKTPKITIVAPGTYRATLTINGCESTDTIRVVNDCYITIPNIFTPNGDGVNDYFFPRQLLSSGMVEFDMNIYNRWGQLIFSSTSLDGRGWDGNLNGVPQPEGVYVYMINAVFKDGQRENHKGNVTLLR